MKSDELIRDGDDDPTETREWLEALRDVLAEKGPARARGLLRRLLDEARRAGVEPPEPVTATDSVNTIPRLLEPPYPGDRRIETRIENLVRWNATAMVVRANKSFAGLGGHISTFASAATLYEVGFHHFFHGPDTPAGADMVYIQGQSAPGIYARAFLEGRLRAADLDRYRREVEEHGLSAYPHPWLMPDFWQFPTVSLGLGPLMAIYQARFMRYLGDRGLRPPGDRRVWAFLGDGEMDEPESLGAIGLAARERLDNLIFVINCNLQRLDGPVRGNGKIVQELETAFRGAGWNVLKVLWGSSWDPLLEADRDGLLVRRLNELLDGESQKYLVETGTYARNHFFGHVPELLEMVAGYSDEQLQELLADRGGHDAAKVHAAYKAAMEHTGSPTVILAQTVKGYGLGEAGEGRNVTHQQKKLNESELRHFRERFDLPVSDRDLAEIAFYEPGDDSEEILYLRQKRQALGGPLPCRRVLREPLAVPGDPLWQRFQEGVDREVSTTMVFAQMLTQLMKDPHLGDRVVPILPDAARTFGMESLFRQFGIYSTVGQLYEPVDKGMLLYYREASNGQILEEGVTEAGSMASFIAAGTAYAHHGVDAVPFFIFYSMFGLQRVGDLVWAAADQRARGFLVGATSGRTTLNGEGLQHQDGHSPLLASVVPNLLAYDPAFAYELAVILRDGLARMYERREDVFYYLTLYNESYPMPAMPAGSAEGILRGIYRLTDGPAEEGTRRVHLLGSGPLLREALRARELLQRYGVAAAVWSVTSYQRLRDDALEIERWNLLHPGAPQRIPYVVAALGDDPVPIVAVTDYIKAVPDQVARWFPGRFTSLGTDGFGRSDTREVLRRFFEVDAEFIAAAALHQLARCGVVKPGDVEVMVRELGLDPDKPYPAQGMNVRDLGILSSMNRQDPDDLERYRWTCERTLHWHGNRTAAELLAEIPADLGLDRYGAGGAVETLEDEMRTVLGKPAVVFMPSGTMAQQIALRIHADRRGTRAVAFHPTCHLELHEEKGYQRLHGLLGITIGDARGLITIDDLRGIRERLAAVLFELPQREIGGRLPSWTDLEEQVTFVRAQSAAVHLDGARLWECTPYYDRSPAAIAALFDTVYVSLYKGLGGLAGCCLAGEEDVIAEARVWRRRHGGTLFGLWPNAASGLAALRKRLPLMPRYFEHARAIAEAIRGIRNVEIVPDPPQTPMMHLHLRVDEKAFLAAARRIAEEQSVFTWARTSPSATPSIRVVEFAVGDATLGFAPDEIAGIMGQLVS